MTMIATMAAGNRVIQVSDRRLVWTTGRLADDESNKAICVSCKNAHFSIAYTGLAQIGRARKRTDIWLAEHLTDMKAGQMGLESITVALKDELTASFRNTGPTQTYGLTLVIAGFFNSLPFVGWITNCRDENWNALVKPTFRFQKRAAFPGPETKQQSYLEFFWDGSIDAIGKPIYRRVRSLKRSAFFLRQPVRLVTNELVSLVRCAARTSSFKSVGRNCMSVSMTPNPTEGFHAEYHPDHKSPASYMPHYIGPNFGMWDMHIWRGPCPPSWWPSWWPKDNQGHYR
jgi:hypothetical protein